MYIYVDVYVCVYICVSICAYIYVYIYVDIYIYVYPIIARRLGIPHVIADLPVRRYLPWCPGCVSPIALRLVTAFASWRVFRSPRSPTWYPGGWQRWRAVSLQCNLWSPAIGVVCSLCWLFCGTFIRCLLPASPLRAVWCFSSTYIYVYVYTYIYI